MTEKRRPPAGLHASGEHEPPPLSEQRYRAAQHGLGASLRYLHRLYMRELQRHLAGRNLSVAQYLHLRILWEEEGLDQTTISHRLGIEKSSSTTVLDSLERDRLIERSRDNGDRRRLIVRLSDKGRHLQSAIMPFARQVADRASSNVGKEELDIFFSVMDRMVANLEAASDQ